MINALIGNEDAELLCTESRFRLQHIEQVELWPLVTTLGAGF